MKKRFFVIIFLLFCLSGCNRQETGKLAELNCQKVIEMMDDKQTFVLVMMSSTCENCEEYRQMLISLFESKPMTIYYVDTDKYEIEELNDLVFNYLYKCINVPTTYIIKDGKVKEMKEEIIPVGELKLWFLENGIIQ